MGRIGIQIDGEYLDLLPNTVLELEEENPFLQLEESVIGQYSLPFSVPCSETNMRLLGYPNTLQIRKSATGIAAILFVDGVQHSRGTIKREISNSNIEHALS